ncbi:hypothetical protein BVC80_8985g54 [Macleaya cordata]|uniref:AB hydrolase-1 domain-containing protein n=1 Tax=Macleaya cordata TaxID=56857 RepID=A0A200QJE9_MACCD|nr:hypothetical protein BVC80_8985g54 [Macleaya cordata]
MEMKKSVIFFLIVFVLMGKLRSNPVEPISTPSSSSSSSSIEGRLSKERKQKHFVLVHGACHGAWSWYKLAALLRSAGHRVTALDLAASGIDSQQVNQLQSISEYFQPLMNFMKHSLPEDNKDDQSKVILVGHSLGGLAISKAMEIFPEKISAAVFVTALMPGPTLNISILDQETTRRRGSLGDSRFMYDDGPENPPTFIFGSNHLSSDLYHLSPPKDLSLATMLIRPIRLYSEEDMSKQIVLSQEKYGSIRRVYVVCDQDKVIPKDFQLWMIKKNPTADVKEITGSDHMVMFSKPQELSACLQEIAEA